MKSYIWLQTADGSIQQVEEEVAMFCPMICREILQTGMGSSKNYAISLPQRVNPAILGLILDYCRFHQVPGRSNKVSISLNLFFPLTTIISYGDVEIEWTLLLMDNSVVILQMNMGIIFHRSVRRLMRNSFAWIQKSYVS